MVHRESILKLSKSFSDYCSGYSIKKPEHELTLHSLNDIRNNRVRYNKDMRHEIIETSLVKDADYDKNISKKIGRFLFGYTISNLLNEMDYFDKFTSSGISRFIPQDQKIETNPHQCIYDMIEHGYSRKKSHTEPKDNELQDIKNNNFSTITETYLNSVDCFFDANIDRLEDSDAISKLCTISLSSFIAHHRKNIKNRINDIDEKWMLNKSYYSESILKDISKIPDEKPTLTTSILNKTHVKMLEIPGPAGTPSYYIDEKWMPFLAERVKNKECGVNFANKILMKLPHKDISKCVKFNIKDSLLVCEFIRKSNDKENFSDIDSFYTTSSLNFDIIPKINTTTIDLLLSNFERKLY